MPSLPLYNLTKKKVGTVDLDDAVFASEVHPHLHNIAVRTHMAKKYEFKTANTLTRTEVSGTRQKMYRQKGTGGARHGNATAPIFVGGGKAHGPRPRRDSFKTNKKVLKKALISVLSMLQKEDRVLVIDTMALEKFSTQSVAKSAKALGVESALFVNGNQEDGDKKFNRSTVNLRGFKSLPPSAINTFDLLKYKNLIVSQDAVKQLTERLKNV